MNNRNHTENIDISIKKITAIVTDLVKDVPLATEVNKAITASLQSETCNDADRTNQG